MNETYTLGWGDLYGYKNKLENKSLEPTLTVIKLILTVHLEND